MELADVLTLVTELWPTRLVKGRVTHVAINDLQRPDGSKVHVRLLIQYTAEAPPPVEGLTHVSLD